jgi:hypothetical protein
MLKRGMRPFQGRDAWLAMFVGQRPDAIDLVAFSDLYDFSISFSRQAFELETF